MPLLEEQYILIEEFDRLYANYKKDGQQRKNDRDYFNKKWARLNELWKQIQFNHDQILMEVSPVDPYFVEKCYEKVAETNKRFREAITIAYQKVGTSTHLEGEEKIEVQRETGIDPSAEAGTSAAQGLQLHQVGIPRKENVGEKPQRGNLSRLDESIRKQEANFRAFTRTVSNIIVENIVEKWEFEDALKTLETRWVAIDNLHLEIDSELNGNNLQYEATFSKYENQFHTLKKEINKKMWSVSYREKTTPKLEIPIFSGNYNNWMSFKDLFTDAIHNNPTMPESQKMQILKTKVKGEAERLIQHLYISSENYATCWEILNHRYDNKKAILTSHLNVLFGVPAIQYNSLAQIKRMHDSTVETLNAIKNLGIDTSSWDPILVHLLTQKMDSETHSEYLDSLKNRREVPILKDLLDFLENRFTNLETASRRKQETVPQKPPQNQTQHPVNVKKFAPHNNIYKNNGNGYIAKSYNVTSFKCPLCKNGHGIYNCKTFLQMPNEKRLSTINKLGLCTNCLFTHFGKPCHSTHTCHKCTKQHNTLLHDALNNSAARPMNSGQPTSNTEHAATTSHVSQENYSEILLATAQLRVQGADGTYHTMRALIDQGSQLSIITEAAAQTLGIKREKCKGVIFGVGQRESSCKGKLDITCASRYNDYTFPAEVVIMTHLIKSLPNKTFQKPAWSNIQNINLADPEFYISRPVDLLLGADIYSNIIMSGIIKGDDAKQPIAQQTKLGWLLCGSAQTFYCNVVINNIEDIKNFWEIEDVVEEGEMSKEEIECVKYFHETTTRNEEGRYEVRLPMKPNYEKHLGKSKEKALAQFKNLEHKLQRQEKLASAYRSFMNEYQQLSHMEVVASNSTPECYLPHHGVERADSLTTKYRVVFNASSKTSSGYSLNDLMYTGPNLQQDMQCLLLKWRQYKYAVTADIEKMYRQILVNKSDTPLQKIIWRESPEHPIQTFELRTITYGTKAAPFLAMMTLRKLAVDERDSFPNAAKIIEESFYMDDLLSGANEIGQGRELISELTSLMKSGGFNLRKWTSNNPELLQNIAKEANVENMIFDFKTENTSKTLGLRWNPVEDTFSFKCQITNPAKLTKRSLLSEMSKIYDPLGWLAPVVIKLKILFQKVWQTNKQWDEEVPDDIKGEWSKLLADLPKINEYQVPRWIRSEEHDVIELIGFCDASIEAYGCVVYAKIKHKPRVVLVAAKTKLVPLNKKITLPRLELCGAQLLSRLILKIKQALSPYETKTYGWTDSKVVLGWLQGEPGRWKPFVANRVQQITEIMPEQQWRYVKTDENPADVITRGLYPSQLLKHDLWKTGPEWLVTDESEKTLREIFTTNDEKKYKTSKVNTATLATSENILDDLLLRHSSLSKITRILAWIRRALTPKRGQLRRQLTLQELRNAKHIIIKYVQTSAFDTEVKHLRKHGKVNNNSKLISLFPYIDKENILRVGGRLEQAKINIEMKHPKIIPGGSRLASLLVDQAHKLTFHGGPRLTQATLRQEYWITGGNNFVKKELRKCVTCRKHEGKKEHQLMGDLPAARSNPASPFYHTGVDYTGFVDIKTNKGKGARTLKGYIAIFVCMVTKAVHLELVSDLTSSAFIAALRRMSARRGAPHHLYSDNGTNFVGANNILQNEWKRLQEVFNESFLTEVTEMNIEWHFNAPAWPSAGGLWERAVRSLKHHLKRVVGEQKLTFEEFSTILAQLEACLNSRPLCALTEDIDDLNFLTPAHFLTGRAGVTMIETDEDARTRWYLTQRIFRDIWRRWKTEYLSQLTARRKWQQPHYNIKIGDLVVIHDDNLPSGKWALGRVLGVHPGSDGYVRVVTLKTKNGIIKRPVIKLSVLPLDKQCIEQKETERRDETKHKEKRQQTNIRTGVTTILMTFLYFMTLTSTVFGFNATSLKTNQGLYFDKLSNVQLARDEWKIVAYFDLNPYWEGITAYEKYYQHLEKVCFSINQLSHCDIIMLQLRHAYAELQHINKVLLNQHVSTNHRRRRGLINGVGNIANALFGVLDDSFAEQYKRDIELVRKNQKQLALLWKNQTSVVEAEYNLLKRTEETVEKQHKIINKNLMELDQSTRILAKKVSEAEIMTEFSLSALAANNLLIHLRNIQDTLLDTITSVYNGKLNAHLIDPNQLQRELSVISRHLTNELTLPIDNIQSNMHNIYQLLRVKTKLSKQYAIFEIKIPLISRDIYELYNVISVPHQMGRNMINIMPIKSHVAINLQKDLYLPVSRTDLNNCIIRDSSTYLCQLKTPIYRLKTDQDLCIKDVENPAQCKTLISGCQTLWISLATVNQYLHFCCDRCQLRNICKDQITAHELVRANIIMLKPDCVVKNEIFTFFTHKQQATEMIVENKVEIPEMAPINYVINLTVSKYNTENMTNNENERLLEEVGKNIKIMKQSNALAEDVSIHDIHHYIGIYLLWGLVFAIAVGFVYRRVRGRRQEGPAATPVAATAEPSSGPQPPARTSDPEHSSARVQVNERESEKSEIAYYKDRGTTPVLKKISFSGPQ